MKLNFMPVRTAVVSAVVVLLAGAAFYPNRTRFHWYHLARVSLFGDIIDRSNNYTFASEDRALFNGKTDSFHFGPKWRYRIAYTGSYSEEALVDDVDGDGIAEVYLGSYSRSVYALDGRTGEKLWEFRLPFGAIGRTVLRLEDVNDDGKKELLVGTQITLPIRVYALRTDRGLSDGERVLWVRNLAGDFLEGGLTSVKNTNGKVYVIAATRDAPYSRGTINVLDGQGRFVYPPIGGVDICLQKPALADVDHDGNYDVLVHGSHKFYGAEYGHKIAARWIDTGEVLWVNDMQQDTGYQINPVVDVDGDGREELVVLPDNNSTNRFSHSPMSRILDLRTGEEEGVIPGNFTGAFSVRGQPVVLYYDQQGNLVSRDMERNEINYVIPPAAHGGALFVLDLDGDGDLELLTLKQLGNGTLALLVYSAESGVEERRFEDVVNSDEILAYHHPAYRLRTLADTDGDGYWELLLGVGEYMYVFDLPFKIQKGYDPFHPIPSRSVTNAGYVFPSR